MIASSTSWKKYAMSEEYLLIKIIAEGDIGEQQLIRTIWRNISSLYGEFGTSRTGLWLIEYERNKYGILRTNTEALPMVRTSLAVIRQIEGNNCILIVEGVSGTIEALKKKHLAKIKLDIPEEIQTIYRTYRPTGLHRAFKLEKPFPGLLDNLAGQCVIVRRGLVQKDVQGDLDAGRRSQSSKNIQPWNLLLSRIRLPWRHFRSAASGPVISPSSL
jgi:RNase P/RNase MRP subunit POP5